MHVMNSKGILNKMTFVNKGSEFNIIPSYELEMGSTKLDLSDIIGKSINLRFLYNHIFTFSGNVFTSSAVSK